MRCDVCGRPPKEEVDAGREVLFPREVYCTGCHVHLAQLRSETRPVITAMETARGEVVDVYLGDVRAYTDAQAKALAKLAHHEREQAQLVALRRWQFKNIIDGKHGDNPDKDLEGTPAEIADAKAHAAELLRQLDAAEAAARAEREEVERLADQEATMVARALGG